MRMRMVAFGLGLVLLASLVSLWPKQTHVEASASYFNNRVWAERIPKDSRDMVVYLMPMKVAGKQLGFVRVGSRYRSVTDVFRHQLEGERLRMEFPQDQKKADFMVRTFKCKGKAPAPFDLCLEMKRGKKTLKFYSRTRWRTSPGSATVEPFGFPMLQGLEDVPPCNGRCVNEMPLLLDSRLLPEPRR